MKYIRLFLPTLSVAVFCLLCCFGWSDAIAADQGDAAAQFKLGLYYAKGDGVPQDYAEAVRWFRKAADQGYAEAQYNLGVCYYNGQGVPQDLKGALNALEAVLELEPSHSEARRLKSEVEESLRKEEAMRRFQSEGIVLLPDNVELEMIRVKVGSFTMGSPEDEEDRFANETCHRVTLTRDYWLGKYEVTQEQWQAVMGSNPSEFKGARLPVEKVSWNDAQEFCRKLNSMYGDKLPKGYHFALPTEAQWECACRAGEAGPYSGGSLDQVAWYDDNSGGKTHEVGTKAPNAWGFHDMHGNVWEWCQDWYDDYTGDVTDPEGPSSGSRRVCRGGSLGNGARRCRAAIRFQFSPGNCNFNLGFRLAFVPVQ